MLFTAELKIRSSTRKLNLITTKVVSSGDPNNSRNMIMNEEKNSSPSKPQKSSRYFE